MSLLRRLLLLLLVFCAPVVLAQDRVRDPGVLDRMQLMQQSKSALDTLYGMMGNRIRFDKRSARAARRILIRATGEIPHRFRERHVDPLSNARNTIWINWPDFKSRAAAAHETARALNTRSLPGLRRTVPHLMQACLSCHESYRAHRKMTKTH